MRWLFGRRPAEAAAPKILRLAGFPAAIYAIGDIHGCLSLFQQLEEAIIVDGAALPGRKLIVCLGDVIDRGPDSAGVVARLLDPAPVGFDRVTLRGNHEQMFEQFLTAPARNLRWLQYGGAETLRSYAITPESDAGFEADGALLSHKVQTAIPAAHRAFLATLPCGLEVGRYRFAHAGYDLGAPAARQSQERLLWGPAELADHSASDQVLVHGHTPVDQTLVTPRRINTDLGVYLSGQLGAVRLMPDGSTPKVFSVSQTNTAAPAAAAFQDIEE